MASKNRHNAAFVVGSVLGAVAGAAVALWKTPYTGEELRSKLTGAGAEDGAEVRAYTAPTLTGTTTGMTSGEGRSIKDKVLSGVEKTLAPIVGVELGKTANDTGPTTMDSGQMKVSPDYGSAGATGATTGTGSETFGLSRDKVDAEKWAQAYGTGASAPTTASSTPTPEPAQSAETGAASQEYGSTLLRHPHAWKDDSDTAAATGETGDTKLGLSRDKVNADEWAQAYGSGAPAPETQATQVSQPAAETTSTSNDDADSARLRPRRSWGTGDETPADTESEKLGLSRDKVNADEWAAAYGTEGSAGSTQDTHGSGSGYASKAAESEAQTGLGAKPAYPGSDQTGHEPVDNTAPDSNVVDVERGAGEIRTDSGLTSEDAASVEDLTSPKGNHRVPDSLRAPDERNYHPFPDLGGKDN